jgi:uncharacterized membrane protein YoaT (DUF817 family)
MDPATRSAIIFVGILFVALFGGSALVVAGRDGFDFLTVVSLVIAVMILLAVIAAIREPPRR